MQQVQNFQRKEKFLIPVFATYLTLVLTPIVLVYKIITIFGFTTSCCIYLFPLTYAVCDIIAEVYGYETARQAIWLGVLSNVFFSGAISLLVQVQSPADWAYQAQYELVLGGVFSIAVGAVAGTLLGAFINVYLLTKWRLLAKGRFFMIRSIGSSVLGEVIFTYVSVLIVWYGRISTSKMLMLGFTLFLSKIVMNFIMVGPAAIAVHYLKKAEGTGSCDDKIDFNPFKLSA